MTLNTDAEQLDLSLTRIVDLPRERLWQAWTSPEHVKKWWAPAPLITLECEMDLEPGGAFRTVMQAPDGTRYPVEGCFLEIVPCSRLVFTDALDAGFRPAREPFFTAVITLEDLGGRTRYTARALHRTPADRRKHEDMGFHQGWGKCLDQLVEVAHALQGSH